MMMLSRIITSAILFFVGGLVNAQAIDIHDEVVRVHSPQFFEQLGTIIARFRDLPQSRTRAIYYLKHTRDDGQAEFRWGSIDIGNSISSETYFVQPYIKDPLSATPVFVYSPKERTQSFETPKSIFRILNKQQAEDGYFVQGTLLDGRTVVTRNEFLFVSIQKGPKNLVSIIKNGPVLLLYNQLKKETNNARMEELLKWVLNFYDR
jgi:hypothetical protein